MIAIWVQPRRLLAPASRRSLPAFFDPPKPGRAAGSLPRPTQARPFTAARLVPVGLLHVAAAALLLWARPSHLPAAPATPLRVRLLDTSPAEPVVLPTPPVEETPPTPSDAVQPVAPTPPVVTGRGGPREIPVPVRQPEPAPAARAEAPEAIPPVPDTPPPRPAAPEPSPEPVAAPRVTAPMPATAPPPTPPRFTPATADAAYLSNPAPPYPPMSERLEEQGTVLLRVNVRADGRVSGVTVRKSSGFERLDDAARETVADWRFAPATRGDDKVADVVEVPINFRHPGTPGR